MSQHLIRPRNHGQVARDENWQQAYEIAFEDFQKNMAAELTKTGFK